VVNIAHNSKAGQEFETDAFLQALIQRTPRSILTSNRNAHAQYWLSNIFDGSEKQPGLSSSRSLVKPTA
jgi:hypothetical protein